MLKYTIEIIENPYTSGGPDCLELRLRSGIGDSREYVDQVVSNITTEFPELTATELENIITGDFAGYMLQMPET